MTSSASASTLGEFQAERPRGRKLDHEFELGRLLDWDVCRLAPMQNLVHQLGSTSTPEQSRVIWPIGKQSARLHKLTAIEDRWQPRGERHRRSPNADHRN